MLTAGSTPYVDAEPRDAHQPQRYHGIVPLWHCTRNHRGYSEVQGGIAVACYGVGSLAGAFLGGKPSDRFGFYYLQFLSLFLAASCSSSWVIWTAFPVFAGGVLSSMVNEAAFRRQFKRHCILQHTAKPYNNLSPLNRLCHQYGMGWAVHCGYFIRDQF